MKEDMGDPVKVDPGESVTSRSSKIPIIRRACMKALEL